MKKFFKGFVYAGNGIMFCIKNERSMRVHLCFTVYMFCFLTIFDFFTVTKAEIAVLLGFCALVMSFEAVNTAIEKTVDLVTKEKNPLAGIAKDVTAGAVLISATISVVAGTVILFQPEAFVKMFEYYKTHTGMLAIFIASVFASVAFILVPSALSKRKENKNG